MKLKKVLHIGWGFRPWHSGGLISYTEDLMEEQVKHGYEVSYLFSGRQYPFFSKPKINKYFNNGIFFYELINSPLINNFEAGISKPLLHVTEPVTESLFRIILKTIKPDIVHIHELAGFPSSIIDILKDEYNVPTVMTLHNYFLLCPTINLYDREGRTCFKKNGVGEKCAKCCADCVEKRSSLIARTLMYELGSNIFVKMLIKIITLKENLFSKPIIAKGIDYQNLRQQNIRRLKKIDFLISQSFRTEEIYRNFLGNNIRIQTVHSTLKSIEAILPKRIEIKERPIVFASINALTSKLKGSEVILGALKILKEQGLQNRFRFIAYGHFDRKSSNYKEATKYENLFLYGPYKSDDLNSLLDEVDVGIIPSVCEETYGFAGLEFIAKGVPVIGNKKGGIPDYVKVGKTGWLNETSDARGLARIMTELINNPAEIEKLNKKIVKNVKNIIPTMSDFSSVIDKIYYRVFLGK